MVHSSSEQCNTVIDIEGKKNLTGRDKFISELRIDRARVMLTLLKNADFHILRAVREEMKLLISDDQEVAGNKWKLVDYDEEVAGVDLHKRTTLRP